jgi:N-acetylmuramoyl-L-alanine amidase
MSARIVRLAFAGLAVVGGLSVAASQAASSRTDVQRVRLGGDASETRIVVEVARSVSGKLSDADPADRKLAVTLPGAHVASPQEGKGLGLVKRWQLEETAGGARLRLELSEAASIKGRFLLPPADGVSHYRYVIDLKRAPGSTAVAKAGLKPSAPAPMEVVQLTSNPRRKKIVVIDAGHGGKDPGASGVSRKEKEITLAAARSLKAKLEKTGRYQVVMTRDADAYVGLETRVRMARRADADLFISLHADSGADAKMRGASVYTLSEQASGRAAKFVNKDDWFMKASLTGDTGVSDILFDLTQRMTKNRSAQFAEVLLDHVDDHQPLLRRSHRDAGLMVLLAPDVPAVLLEMGFITNKADEATLANPAKRAELMAAVARSIDAYFEREAKTNRL